MNEKEMIIEDGVLFVDSDFFGDNKEHEYDCECKDGHAECFLMDENSSAPRTIEVEYPKLSELTDSDKDKILLWRGLFDLSYDDIHFGDVCVCFGKIVKH